MQCFQCEYNVFRKLRIETIVLRTAISAACLLYINRKNQQKFLRPMEKGKCAPVSPPATYDAIHSKDGRKNRRRQQLGSIRVPQCLKYFQM